MRDLFSFAKALTQGCAFSAPSGNITHFVGWTPPCEIRPGSVLLDATAGLDAANWIAPGRRGSPMPWVKYDNLEITHVPQHTAAQLGGKARNIDGNGRCAKQRLVVSCSPNGFLAEAARLFPGAKVTMKDGMDKRRVADEILRILVNPDAPDKISGNEMGERLGGAWRSLSKAVTDRFVEHLAAIGWRYVKGRGRGGSYFERTRKVAQIPPSIEFDLAFAA